MDLDMYYDSNVCLYGYIKNGCLKITSEVYGDGYDSEKHYTFTQEDTNKLFSIVGVVELCRKEHVLGMEQLLAENDIHPQEFCI